MPNVITLTGPSGSGKSTVLKLLTAATSDAFSPIIVPKYTTRAPRGDDGDDVICVPTIPIDCDIVYEQYGTRYGFKLETLFERLANGQCPIIVLNDIRAVEDVRDSVGRIVRSIYLFRATPTLAATQQLAATRTANRRRANAEAETRFRKAQAIHRIYIENIHIFDHVILNYATFAHLDQQLEAIIRGLGPHQEWPLSA